MYQKLFFIFNHKNFINAICIKKLKIMEFGNKKVYGLAWLKN